MVATVDRALTVACGSCRATAEVPDCEACPADVRALPVGWSWLIAVAHAHPGRREWRLLVCGACVGPTDRPKFFTCSCGAWQAYHDRGEIGLVCACDRGVPLVPVEGFNKAASEYDVAVDEARVP